jgi:hypothetical protein
LEDWASFQPRRALPKTVRGRVFYPDVFSHVFEKYWDYLPSLNDHPDFASESPYCQEQAIHFSSNLAQMDLTDFQPSPAAEAKQFDIETVEEAAISRLPDTAGRFPRRLQMSTVLPHLLSRRSCQVGSNAVIRA